MDELSRLRRAIRSRKPIRFEYNHPEKVRGLRVANPHAVFIRRLKSGEEHVYLAVWQTGGVSDSVKPMPGWRQFLITYVKHVLVLADEPSFDVAEDYNPSFYEYPIEKI